MSRNLGTLANEGILPPLALHFARFVAQEAGLPEDHWAVVAAALVSSRNLAGDVCVDLADFSGQPLFADDESSDPWIGPSLDIWLETLRQIPCVGSPDNENLLILHGTRLYLARHWRDESQVAGALQSRLEVLPPPPDLAAHLDHLFPPSAGTDWQKVAAALAVTRRFAVISGGPGTGKTTTVIKILALLLSLEPGLRIRLAAPTGKAAARLSQSIRSGRESLASQVPEPIIDSIPEQAVTVHRLLGMSRGGFVHSLENPLALDCLVVDEASMVDLTLMARLTEALPASARLILLGDRDQLASVDAGSVLGDITGQGREIRYSTEVISMLESQGIGLPREIQASDPMPPVADAIALLRKSWRFDATSGIGRLAQAVNEGVVDQVLACLDEGREDLEWLAQTGSQPGDRLINWSVSRYALFLEETRVEKAIERFDQVRVLAALRQGPWGVEELNRRIEAALLRRGLIAGGREYHGLPIMITRNDSETGLFNGDTGLLWRHPSGHLEACFQQADGDLCRLPVRSLPAWEPAWALTVHKSQGSEFDQVLLVLPPQSSPVLTRELIYTGITRARRHCTLAGDREVLTEAIRTRTRRASGLKERLGWG